MLQRMTGELPRATSPAAGESLDYKASYQAKVDVDHGDGTLDITPTDKRFQSLQHVPCMFGLPGVKVTVEPGSYVFFTFWSGQPGNTYVSSWDPTNAVVSMTLSPGSANAPAAARVGDSVDFSALVVTAPQGGGPCTLAGILTIKTGSSIVKIGD